MPNWLQKAVAFLIGLAATIVLLQAGLWIGGSLKAHRRLSRIRGQLQAAGAVRVLCVGDSMTAGGYPAALETELNRRGRGTRFTVIDRGQVARGIEDIAASLEPDLKDYAPDIVVLMTGIDYPSIQRGEDRHWWYGLRLGRFVATLDEELREKRRLREAARGAESLPAQAQASGDSDEAQGDYSYWQGDYRRAAARYGRALASGGSEGLRPLWRSALLQAQGRRAEAWSVLAAGIARNPQDRRLLKCAAEDALRQDELARAEGLLGRAAEIYPPEWGSLVELSYLYLRNHQFAQAAALRARMRLLAVTDERMLRCYAVLSSFLGDEAQAQAFLGKADELFLRQEAPKHRDTYRKMAQAVLSRKLALFCMQYPMRKLEQLKAMTGELEGAQFVDNEGIFKDAVKGGSYGDYFIDQYGGDFGHLTAKGNELLARHLADQVLKTTGL